mgnify:CR=1 FL=1
MVFVSLTPYGFGLRLNTALSTENCNGTIKYTQGTFNFYSKVNVTRGINDIDSGIAKSISAEVINRSAQKGQGEG